MRVINQIVTGGGHHLVPTKWTLGLQFRLMPISVAISPAFQAIRKHEKHGFDNTFHATYHGFQSHLPSFQAGFVPPGWLHEAVNAYYTLDSLATFVWRFLVFPCKFQPILEEPQNTWGNWGSWGKMGKIGEDGEVSAQCAGLHIPKPTIFLRVGRLSDSGFRVWKHICWT